MFGLSASLVVGAGIALARSGDALATRTGLGGLFVGMLLMAAATSLPEIVTDASAAIAGAPDLAIGDLFGSSMANMAILAIVDLAFRRRVWPTIGLGHARVAAIAIGLTAFVLIAIESPLELRIGWIGAESFIVVAAYILAASWVNRANRAEARAAAAGQHEEVLTPIGLEVERPAPLRVHVLTFAGAAAVVLVAAPFVAFSAEGIAMKTGVSQTFLGVTLLATATSLPELAASIAAVRIGAHDLAVGNLFGSNAFNMTVVLFIDAAYLPGPVLAAVSESQVIAGVGAILLMGIAMAAIVSGPTTRLRRGEPSAVLLLAVYIGIVAASWAGTA